MGSRFTFYDGHGHTLTGNDGDVRDRTTRRAVEERRRPGEEGQRTGDQGRRRQVRTRRGPGRALGASQAAEGRPADREELEEITELDRRTIFYLLRVWRTFGHLPRDQLVEIKWTKLAVIAENSSPGEAERDLALAKSCVAKELPRRLKGGEERGKIRTVHLRLTESQYEELSTTLLANGARRPKKGWGLSGKEDALMRALRRL